MIPLLLLFGCIHAFAQKNWDLGVGLGGAYYIGELDPFPDGIGLIRPAGVGFLRYQLNNTIALRADGVIGMVAGADSRFKDRERINRGLRFYSPFLEGAARIEIYPFGLYKNPVLAQKSESSGATGPSSSVPSEKKLRKISPFISIGAGLSYAYPYINYQEIDGPNPALDYTKVAADRQNRTFLAPIIPVGGGLRIRINQRTSLGLEAAIRIRFSDYLDGLKAVSNSKADDWYAVGLITLSRSFGKAKQQGLENTNGTQTGLTDSQAMNALPDADRDSVPDASDKCPNLPGFARFEGCPDTDLDGILDSDDACPNDPGPVQLKGCPGSDRDLDGIADVADKCPDMPGIVLYEGCPDTDDDGIPDHKDNCPGIKGMPSLMGCPDTDGDGVADQYDTCPDKPGSAANSGCPGPIAQYLVGVPFKALYFNSQKQDWFESSYLTLTEVIQILNDNPSYKVRIEGHTDNSGELPANQLLSEQRAKKCYDYLLQKGIDASRMQYSGFGASRPAPSKNPNSTEARQLSRRVEIYFFKS